MKFLEGCPMDRQEIDKILQAPIPYADERNDQEEEQCKSLVEALTEEEVELAAQSSYAYFLAVTDHENEKPGLEIRIKMATHEARRHLFHTKYEVALDELKAACKYRKEQRVDLMRACFVKNVEYDSPEDEAAAEKMRRDILQDVKKQAAFVRGLDRDGRALMIVMSRMEPAADDADFVLACLYTMERAVACTEYASEGRLEKICVVLDFGSFTSARAPSLAAVKQVVNTLQHRYSERLRKLVVVDAPLWMRTMYGILKPFLDPETRAKFILVTGKAKKEAVFSEFVDESQAMPFMLPSGKCTEPVDMDKFCKVVPFHLHYDDPRAEAFTW